MIKSPRMFRNAFRSLPILLFLPALYPVLASAAPDSPRTAPADPSPLIPEREIRDWRILIERGDAYLSANASIVDSIAEELPKHAREMRHRMLGLEVRLFRLLSLYGPHRKTPVFLYDMEEQIRSIDRRMRLAIELMEKAKKTLAAVEEFVPAGPATAKMLGYESTADIPALADLAPMLADFKRRDGEICARAAALDAQVSAPLGAADRFIARVEKLRKTAAGETGGVLRGYYLKPEGNLLAADGWRQARACTVIWFRNFAAVDLTFNQYDDRVWTRVLARALLTAVLLIVGARLLLRRLEQRSGVTGLARGLFPSAVWLSAGLALCIGVSLPSFTRSAFVIIMIWIFLSRGLISLGERLRSLFSPAPAPRGPWRITPLWGAVAVGNIIQSLDFRTESLALLWSVALVLLWLALLAMRGAGGGARRALLWFLPTLLLCTLLGWVNLAVFSATLVLVVCIGAALSAGIAASKRRFPLDDPQGRLRPLRIVRDVCSPPNVFIAVIIAGLSGYAVYLGGGPVLRLLLGMKIEWRHVTLHIASIPLIVAGYFATRTSVSIVGDLIHIVRHADTEASEGEIISLQVLSRYIIWFVFLMGALSLLGFTMGNLALVAGGLSVGIGFGMQNIINNFVSGIILLLGREIQPGDMIERDGNFSRVEQVTLRNTILRTYAGKTIIAPNSEFITKSFSNWTYRDPRIRGNITVKVPASVDSRQIEELLLKVARANPAILKFPVPSVRLENFAQGNLEFSLRAWVAHPRDWKVISDVRHEVFLALKEQGIAVA